MKDLAPSVELGVSQRRGVNATAPKVWLKNELVRVGLAESLCTYVMMVREASLQKISKVLDAFTLLDVIICSSKLTKMPLTSIICFTSLLLFIWFWTLLYSYL